MTLHVKAPVTSTKALMLKGSSKFSDVTGYPAYTDLLMGAGARDAAGSKSRDEPVVSGFTSERSSDLGNDEPKMDVCGRNFLFDRKCESMERTRAAIAPLPRLHRPDNLHPLSLTGQPFTQGSFEGCKLSTWRNTTTFSEENCKLSRPKVNHPTYKQLTAVKEKQKSPSYPDPMVGASRSYIQRLSELLSLEGETVKQEKLRKMKKSRKPSS